MELPPPASPQDVALRRALEALPEAERKRLADLGRELDAAYALQTRYDAGRLAKDLGAAQRGARLLTGGIEEPIPAGEQVAHLRQVQADIAEGPLHANHAKATINRLHIFLRNPAKNIFADAIAILEAALPELPAMKPHPAFAEWAVPAPDPRVTLLTGLREAARSLRWELDSCDKGGTEFGEAMCRRAGAF